MHQVKKKLAEEELKETELEDISCKSWNRKLKDELSKAKKNIQELRHH